MFLRYNDNIHFHIMVERYCLILLQLLTFSGLIFLCMADASFVKRRAYAFLIDVRNLFLSKFGTSWQSAIAYEIFQLASELI